MTSAYLMLANVALLARLFILFKDDVASARAWAGKSIVELLALVALYGFSWATLAAAVVIVGANTWSWHADKPARQRNFVRLLLGFAELAMLSVALAPFFGHSLLQTPQFVWPGPVLGEVTVLAPIIRLAADYESQLALFGLLLAANEANLAIRTVFEWLDLKPRVSSEKGSVVDVGEFNRGRIIGMLERTLLYVFILQDQYGAIGFILAAKAFTRFKALDDRPFAEYVLIGTLLSACWAFLAGGVVRWMSIG